MNSDSQRYLPHLVNSLPEKAHGYMSSGYSIALEGLRRGLDLKIRVKYVRRKQRVIEYVLSDGTKSHHFQITRGDKVSKEAVKICINKDLTKQYLIEAGVKTPQGDVFQSHNTAEEIMEYAKELGYPVVLKPTDGTGGVGVIANIKNEEELVQALDYVRGELKSEKIILEKYFKGEDHRFYVVGNEVVGVFKRDPLSVTGNGKDTIKKLLKYKNEERRKIPSLSNTRLKVTSETDRLLERLGYTMKSVPKKGEVVYLKTKNNVSSGGEAVDVTDETTEEMKKIAVSAIKAIPTLVQGGVDLMVDKENNEGAVLEVNSRAHIRTHLFPSYGQARDVPSAIIDYYFPETKGYDITEASKLFFDFDYVYDAFTKGNSKYIEIPRIPKDIELTRVKILTDALPANFASWIQTNAVKYGVNGSAKIVSKTEAELKLGGNERNISNLLDVIEKRFENLGKSLNMSKEEMEGSLKQGFSSEDLRNSHSDDETHALIEENRKLKAELLDIKNQRAKAPDSKYKRLKKKIKSFRSRSNN